MKDTGKKDRMEEKGKKKGEGRKEGKKDECKTRKIDILVTKMVVQDGGVLTTKLACRLATWRNLRWRIRNRNDRLGSPETKMATARWLPWLTGAVGAEWLDCSPPTKTNRVHSPAGSHPDFLKWESCRCRWVTCFLGNLPFTPSLRSGAASLSPHFTLRGSQGLVVKSRPYLSSLLNLTYSVKGLCLGVDNHLGFRQGARFLYLFPLHVKYQLWKAIGGLHNQILAQYTKACLITPLNIKPGRERIAKTHCEKVMCRNPLRRPPIGDEYCKQRADIGKRHADTQLHRDSGAPQIKKNWRVTFPHQAINERRIQRWVCPAVDNRTTETATGTIIKRLEAARPCHARGCVALRAREPPFALPDGAIRLQDPSMDHGDFRPSCQPSVIGNSGLIRVGDIVPASLVGCLRANESLIHRAAVSVQCPRGEGG
ncbi:hypothetical protein PR048_031507 [Dryococelus australis]|uniref:Uncharacterized protein n=1 Tax=Dryococelus australis TaxID=614101 RepID=A0ABQ9G9I3_9NEOP|nr:hypothetical protein PR048_031507 [Dryococelus australis]